jgi:hypothetical protein
MLPKVRQTPVFLGHFSAISIFRKKEPIMSRLMTHAVKEPIHDWGKGSRLSERNTTSHNRSGYFAIGVGIETKQLTTCTDDPNVIVLKSKNAAHLENLGERPLASA